MFLGCVDDLSRAAGVVMGFQMEKVEGGSCDGDGDEYIANNDNVFVSHLLISSLHLKGRLR